MIEVEYNVGDWLIRWTGFIDMKDGTQAGCWFAYDVRAGRRPRESITSVTGSTKIQIVPEGERFEVENPLPLDADRSILETSSSSALSQLLTWITDKYRISVSQSATPQPTITESI